MSVARFLLALLLVKYLQSSNDAFNTEEALEYDLDIGVRLVPNKTLGGLLLAITVYSEDLSMVVSKSLGLT